MKVINMFGGPGCGKSTMAASLFCRMKVGGYKVELVTEFAKEMVYEDRLNVLQDQLYILSKQSRRVSRLRGKVDYVITDSPLLLTVVYNDSGVEQLDKLCLDVFNQYDNVNFVLERQKNFQEYGRVHSLKESIEIDKKIREMLLTNGVSYDTIPPESSEVSSNIIYERIINNDFD